MKIKTRIKEAKSKIAEKLSVYPTAAKFMSDYSFRAIVYASGSVLISVAYAIFNGVIALMDSSIWFGSLAGYYFLLAIMRGSVLLSNRSKRFSVADNNERGESNRLKLHIGCGAAIITTILALSLAIMQMVEKNDSFKYAGLMIYVGAVYTVIKVTMAIRSFFKAKKRNNTTVETIKNISLADAAVSILALQTAMFQSFANGEDVSYANAATGAAVCAFILGLGIYMIVKANLKLKNIKKELASSGREEK